MMGLKEKLCKPLLSWILIVLLFYSSVNEVMSSRSINSGTVPGQA